MDILIFAILLMIILVGMGIYWFVKDNNRSKRQKHYISMFKPGYTVKVIQIEGHVRPKELIIFEREIIDAKDGYIIVKDDKGWEHEKCISSLFAFNDIVELYDGNGKLVEKISKEDFDDRL